MRHTHLGRTGLKVSPICLGTMNFAWKAGETESHAIMDRALELGITFFDTADQYGGPPGDPAGNAVRGDTERVIGRWWADALDKRDSVVLATKVYHAMPEGHPDPDRGTAGLSARKIIRHCEDCLQRLKTDRIDVLQMHHIDRAVPVDEVWEAYETLLRQGKVLYAGSSNFPGWQIARYSEQARARRLVGLVSEQSLYNLAARTVELEIVPACRHYGLGLIPYSPLAGGMLGGVTEISGPPPEGRRATQASRWLADHGDRLRDWERLCADLGHRPGEVALAWLLASPAVTAPIVGPRNADQLDAAVRATEITLSEETLARLDAIWPGPGGEAPEAYAW